MVTITEWTEAPSTSVDIICDECEEVVTIPILVWARLEVNERGNGDIVTTCRPNAQPMWDHVLAKHGPKF